jgi:hypothetical protein
LKKGLVLRARLSNTELGLCGSRTVNFTVWRKPRRQVSLMVDDSFAVLPQDAETCASLTHTSHNLG